MIVIPFILGVLCGVFIMALITMAGSQKDNPCFEPPVPTPSGLAAAEVAVDFRPTVEQMWLDAMETETRDYVKGYRREIENSPPLDASDAEWRGYTDRVKEEACLPQKI